MATGLSPTTASLGGWRHAQVATAKGSMTWMVHALVATVVATQDIPTSKDIVTSGNKNTVINQLAEGGGAAQQQQTQHSQHAGL